MPNINLTCVECLNPFYFSERDQEFYKSRGFQQPKRCFHCRQKRKNNGSQDTQQQQDSTRTPAKRYFDERDED